MSYARVFRIESCHNGLGPYQNRDHQITDESFLELLQRHTGVNTHPAFYFDSLKRYPKRYDGLDDVYDIPDILEYSFGFNSLPPLRNWFTDTDLGILHANGFNLVVYESESQETIYYSKQIAFKKQNAKIFLKQNLISLIRKT